MVHCETSCTKTRIWLSAVLVATLAMMPGAVWGQHGKAPATPKQEVAELNSIRGVVKPASEAVLSSQIQGRISRLHFKDGQRFRKGSNLVSLDCTKYKAELAAASAEHRARKMALKNNLRLSTLDSIGKVELEISKAEVERALASVRIATSYVKGCVVKAPFPGRVVKLMVNEHENVFPNDQLVSILDDTSLEIELILSSRSLAWLKKGTRFQFVVDETVRTYPARVREVGASVDPVSQTIRVTGMFRGPHQHVLAGMSGTATFSKIRP